MRIHPELASREHMFLETLDETGDAAYRKTLADTRARSFDMLKDSEEPAAEQLTMEI